MQRRQGYAIAGGLLFAVSGQGGGAADENAGCVALEPAEYRMAEFRSPTPCGVSGGTVLTTASLARLLASAKPLLIDVLPAQRRPPQLASDALWLPPQRRNIPGSVWLPNTGFGLLPAEEERYFRDNLERLTAGDRDKSVVFYCEAECWMSWNAARRAIEWGYRSVYWYPGGTDRWAEAGHELVQSLPVPRGEAH